jgi:hypothetical protein
VRLPSVAPSGAVSGTAARKRDLDSSTQGLRAKRESRASSMKKGSGLPTAKARDCAWGMARQPDPAAAITCSLSPSKSESHAIATPVASHARRTRSSSAACGGWPTTA